jgi:catechol 2,3-dioxygenase-like lactoylglutathione lyase family enzyme
MRIHHVQIMMPRGRAEDALAFYRDLLGLARIPKPADMPNPDGVWFRLGEQELHLGVQDGEVDASSRAHVALLVDDVDALVERLRHARIEARESNPIGELRRAHVRDPFGNRLELMGR